MKYILTILSIILISGCASRGRTDHAQLVSMINLISKPEKYDGKKVGLKGFFVFAIEEHALYFHESDFNNANSKNAIWLTVSEEFMKSYNIEPSYRGYISIEGVFLKNKSNSTSQFSGSLIKIDYIYKIEGRNNPLSKNF